MPSPSLAHLPVSLAHVSDIPDIVVLVQEAYRGDRCNAPRAWTTEADYMDGQRTDRDAVAELLAQPDSVILIVRDEAKKLTACCNVARAESKDASDLKPVAHLGLFAVDPQLQSAGLGSKMMVAAETHAREVLKATEMQMTVVHVRQELIAYYVRRGYVLTGDRMPFPGYIDQRFGIPKQPGLEFVCLRKQLIPQAPAVTNVEAPPAITAAPLSIS